MISETEMLNRIGSHHRTTKNAHEAFLRERGSAARHYPMRRLVLAWGWLVTRA